ncbi:MAG: hypothetical protein P9L92_00745 [Candidatus Electryonea clarkiae]|nr:hypothetical protein [Candidatus Electryonea clarkiae]MDP8287106.1 hypothetical protein [Candidatus Electryonea clarkiae]
MREIHTGSLIFLIIFMLAMLGFPASSSALEILYTGCTNGKFENCRCPNDPLGAVEKRLAEIDRRRELDEVLLFDSGDFMPALIDTLTSRYVVKAMKLQAFDAVGVGDQEIMQGRVILDDIIKNLPVVSANIVFADGTPIAPKYKIIEKEGKKYAITAIIAPDALRFIPPENVDYIKVLDPDNAISEVRDSIPDDVKLIVLSHAGEDADKKFAAKWEGVDLIIGGHSQSEIEGIIENTAIPIVQAGGNGRYLGVAKFRGPKVRAEIIPMRPELPDDQRIIDILMLLKSDQAKYRLKVHNPHNH